MKRKSLSLLVEETSEKTELFSSSLRDCAHWDYSAPKAASLALSYLSLLSHSLSFSCLLQL